MSSRCEWYVFALWVFWCSAREQWVVREANTLQSARLTLVKHYLLLTTYSQSTAHRRCAGIVESFICDKIHRRARSEQLVQRSFQSLFKNLNGYEIELWVYYSNSWLVWVRVRKVEDPWFNQSLPGRIHSEIVIVNVLRPEAGQPKKKLLHHI